MNERTLELDWIFVAKLAKTVSHEAAREWWKAKLLIQTSSSSSSPSLSLWRRKRSLVGWLARLVPKITVAFCDTLLLDWRMEFSLTSELISSNLLNTKEDVHLSLANLQQRVQHHSWVVGVVRMVVHWQEHDTINDMFCGVSRILKGALLGICLRDVTKIERGRSSWGLGTNPWIDSRQWVLWRTWQGAWNLNL